MGSDGVLAVSVSAFEPGCVEAGRKWLGSLGKGLWLVGPLEDVPAATTPTVPGKEVPQHKAEDAKIMSFLDQMQADHGKRSVIVVSTSYFADEYRLLSVYELQIAFGTQFYPKDTAKLHAFIEELISTKTPFIWGHASPSAVVPTDLQAKLEATSTAFHAKWIPQRAVFRHAATGWFVSHGGWNSTQEALSLRVPM
jgi:hypothetical protein